MTELQDDATDVMPPLEPEPRNLAPIFLAIAAMAVLVTLLAASWVVWGRSGISGTPTAAETSTRAVAPATNLPAGATECPAVTGKANGLAKSARGNDVTSCPFAEETRIAYARGGQPSTEQRTVVVYSPVTKQRYDMSCVVTGPGPLVTCTGGNGAVVYLF
jgi:hypothetical protein